MADIDLATHFDIRSFDSGRFGSTSVTLFDQGLVQVLKAAVTGLHPC